MVATNLFTNCVHVGTVSAGVAEARMKNTRCAESDRMAVESVSRTLPLFFLLCDEGGCMVSESPGPPYLLWAVPFSLESEER